MFYRVMKVGCKADGNMLRILTRPQKRLVGRYNELQYLTRGVLAITPSHPPNFNVGPCAK